MPKRINHKIFNNKEHKLCSKCKNWILLSNFYRNSRLWDGLNGVCIPCAKRHNKLSYEKYKQKRKYLSRKYYKDNKEKAQVAQRKYYDKNKEKLSCYRSEWQKQNRKRRNKKLSERYANDINYRVAVNLRNRILKAIGNNQKSGSTLDILGCSIEEFKKYISLQFSCEMSWENHGKVWHIDHIRPCSSFDFSDDDQQRECFHYTNMQPLLVSDNLSKGNSVS